MIGGVFGHRQRRCELGFSPSLIAGTYSNVGVYYGIRPIAEKLHMSNHAMKKV